jgi:diguanylate cyclase (GGDEF)-like protein
MVNGPERVDHGRTVPVPRLIAAPPQAAVTDAFVRLDAQLRFVALDRHGELLIRARAAEAIGRLSTDWVTEPLATDFARTARAALASGRSECMVVPGRESVEWYSIRMIPDGDELDVYFHDVSALKRAEQRIAALADERDRLWQVALATAAGEPIDDVLRLICEQAAGLVGADLCTAVRFEAGRRLCVVGTTGVDTALFAVGSVHEILPGSAIAVLAETGRPLVVDDLAGENFAGRLSALGYKGAVIVPVRVAGCLWGALTVGANRPWPEAQAVAARLQRFAEVAAIAIGGTEARAELVRRAGTDALTGLANSRVFHDSLEEEVRRSCALGRPFCLAVLDVDYFKDVNDRHGHQVGDRVLRVVARRLSELVRTGDVVARAGGDEFALLLVDCNPSNALALIERARQLIAASSQEAGVPVTLTAGIAAWEAGRDGHELFRLADDALYWGKAQGRDVAWIYDATVIRHLDAEPRRELFQHAQSMLGIRALARAIDAKDPSTREHSERVARLACTLARELGWDEARVASLFEAALVHDVGKIGVPDAVLLKPGRLDAGEYEEVKRHAALGADIVEGVLSSEQVLWIRCHHERPDGRGYPDGLLAPDIPEGAAILAVADSFDVMTSQRTYSAPKPVADAVAECLELAGRQFAPEVVAALGRLDFS